MHALYGQLPRRQKLKTTNSSKQISKKSPKGLVVYEKLTTIRAYHTYQHQPYHQSETKTTDTTRHITRDSRRGQSRLTIKLKCICIYSFVNLKINIEKL